MIHWKHLPRVSFFRFAPELCPGLMVVASSRRCIASIRSSVIVYAEKADSYSSFVTMAWTFIPNVTEAFIHIEK